ncbi:TRAP transporter large permease [Alloalcanivorax profundimaris]|uniref:TRAP transporter large permease protein n=1 Tax=Alloalcanivorax profundimaris TaxID=2735259 RepID=A0ABS0ANP4_9GAMM|nr:TRAP transporter large permease [Alloalcanivorax profundimaris]MAO58251.1 C4-dicarboxylate ABC transporter [Alcanivorax sp.]MBM1142287.1 TRAP transporter large permease [Alcanivorax sp. ZXX171]QJX02525.1 TRAP transporter large permease [Alcanivorax sp. IO_7]MAY10034.1 C4-dicarboxylate ABC transporter [Alcanivorax sp.]MBF1803377.1 TRAP transporter large permease [Alloalcanivorax profundimaris]|tara:strand:+ start:567 stop:1874 length:1308 start_codon:yes stop_codon:yes gene_type:complete
MSDVQIGLSGLAVLFVLIALRMPVGLALIGVSFGGLWYLMGWGIAWGSLGLIPYQFSANWVLSSVPMFLLLGYVCYHAQLTQGLFRAARLWLSRVPGGLAVASIFGTTGFAAVCGSSVACSAAMGRVAVPEMIEHRYNPGLATSTVAIAGTVGALLPPSIIMILYGIIAQEPITKLFLGGITAGLLTVLGYIIVVTIRVKLNPELAPAPEERISTEERLKALWEVWPVVMIMVGIFGGLFAGLFTPTEAGAVGASLACVVALCKGTLTWARLRDAVLETLLTTGTILIIAMGASLLTRFLSLSGAGDYLSSMVIDAGASTFAILMIIVLIYLLLGMFLEPIGAMLLTLPIVLPIVDSVGLSLIWFGVVLTKLLEIGMVTPPIGMNIFVIKSVVGNLVSTGAIFKGVLWFLLMDVLVLALLMGVPELVLFLPEHFG